MATRARRTVVPPPYAEVDWSRGMVRDSARGAIPGNAVYDSADFLLDRPGMAYKRGGWGYYSAQPFTGASYIQAVGYGDFTAGTIIVGVGSNGKVLRIGDTGTGLAAFATTNAIYDRPRMIENMMVFPRSNGTSVPKVVTWDGTTLAVADLTTNPPPGKFLSIYKSRPVLAGWGAFPNRVVFGPAAWTPGITTDWKFSLTLAGAADWSYIEGDYPVTGLAALQNALLVFSAAHVERIVGSTPPPDTDMERGTVAALGCIDARSIVTLDNTAIFANQRGVFQTNGTSFVSLTREGGIESYWQSLFSSYAGLTHPICAGAFRDYYIIGGLPGGVCLLCNVPKRAWVRLTNIAPTMFAIASGAADELYYAQSSDRFVATLSGIFSPASGNKADADGTAVQPLLETRLIGDGPWVKTLGYGRLSYDMRDAASDNPTLAVSVAEGVEAPTFAAAPESPFAETTDMDRKRFSVRKRSQAVSIRLQQTNASAKTELYALEVEQLGVLPTGAGGV